MFNPTDKQQSLYTVKHFDLRISERVTAPPENTMQKYVYFLSGPWFVGELIDGQVGACFSFGVFVGGSFLRGGLTYVVGILQVCVYR